jgi:hypothetical protein
VNGRVEKVWWYTPNFCTADLVWRQGGAPLLVPLRLTKLKTVLDTESKQSIMTTHTERQQEIHSILTHILYISDTRTHTHIHSLSHTHAHTTHTHTHTHTVHLNVETVLVVKEYTQTHTHTHTHKHTHTQTVHFNVETVHTVHLIAETVLVAKE